MNAALKNNMTFGGQLDRNVSPEVNAGVSNNIIEEDLERDDNHDYNIDAEMDEAEVRAIESIREEEYTRAKIKRDEDKL